MIIIGLGSNVGNKTENLKNAILMLNQTIMDVVAVSPIYETPALLKPDSPDSWDIPFYNMAIIGETDIEPNSLIKKIKMIEKKLGRKARGNWGPREIDIDILAYDNHEVNEDELQIPHKQLMNRPFAIKPFSDLMPNWVYHAEGEHNGKTIYQRLGEFSADEKDSIKLVRADLNLPFEMVSAA